MLWQFGELGYDKSINCENDITDGSCRLDRKPVAWTLNYDEDSDRMDLYNVTSKMMMLKTEYPSTFNTDDFSYDLNGLVKRINLNDNVGDFDVTIVANFDIVSKTVVPNFPIAGTWYSILNNNTPIEVTNVSTSITLSPGEYIVYGTQPIIDPNDLDSDGIINSEDLCSNTPLGATVDATGCEIFVLPANNFRLQIASETCRDSDNGIIDITAAQNLNYTVTVIGNELEFNETFTTSFVKSDLEAGDYRICITIETQPDYEQCFNVTIDEPEDLAVLSKTSDNKGLVTLNLKGSNSYNININGAITKTSASSIELPLQVGENKISVETEKACQGKYEETIFYGDNIVAFPNPVKDELNVYLGALKNKNAHVNIYSILGNKVFSTSSNQRSLNVDTSRFTKGIYILRVETEVNSKSFKIIKN